MLFTYDDHQAGTAFQDAPGQPNRIRCVRDARWKYAVYLDPAGKAAPEYELYDLESDPDEALNLVDKRTGRGQDRRRRSASAGGCTSGSAQACAASGTLTPPLPRGLVAREAGQLDDAVLAVQRVVVAGLQRAARDAPVGAGAAGEAGRAAEVRSRCPRS